MKVFAPMYARALAWSRHRRAPALLAGLSFVEAIIFPVPPEAMLAPMSVAQPRRALWFATISLLGSLAGAVVGYLLGHYAYELLKPAFEAIGLADDIDRGVVWLSAKVAESPWAAFGALVLAGFAPIPMKLITWAAGIIGMAWLPYLASIAIGRGKRVYLVAIAIRLGGERAERALQRYIEPIGWAVVGLFAAALAAYLIHGAMTQGGMTG